MEPEASLWKILTNLTVHIKKKSERNFPKFNNNPRNVHRITHNEL